MAPLSVPLIDPELPRSNLQPRTCYEDSCCSKTGFIHIRRSHQEHSPIHFTAEDRHRHHREALFFVSSEESAKRKLERTESGQEIPPSQQVDVPLKPLTLWGMVAIIFFAVSGGPFGSEEAVAAVGPLWVLVGFILFPIIWSIPEALMTAELSTMFPGNGGYVFWTTAAFGSRLGFLQGCWSWLSNVTSVAVYPHLLLDYVVAAFPSIDDVGYRFVFLTCFTLLMSYINYRGLHIIGSGGIIAIVLVLGPFLLLSLIGIPDVDWLYLATHRPLADISPMDFIGYLNIMFWNLNSWENCSVLSGEIANPRKTLPRAIFIALIITVAGYIIPLAVGMGVMNSESDYSSWGAGYFQAVGYHVGGRPMALLILIAAVFGCIGQYQSILCSTAYSLQSLGEIGMLPAAIANRSDYDTPTVGISISTLIVISLTAFGFVDIVQLMNSVYCLALLVEFATLIYLRSRCASTSRPFRIPFGILGLVILITPAVITVLVLLLIPPLQGDFMSTYYVLAGIIFSLVAYEVVELGRRRSWFKFCDRPPQNAEEVIQRLKIF